MDVAHPAFKRWSEKLREAYLLARGERLAELRGHRPRLLDERGIHPYSYAWGQVDMLTTDELATWLGESQFEYAGLPVLTLSPSALRRAAREEAESIYRAQVIDEWREEHAAKKAAQT